MTWWKDSGTARQMAGCSGLLTLPRWQYHRRSNFMSRTQWWPDFINFKRKYLSWQFSLWVKNSRSPHHIAQQIMVLRGYLHRLMEDVQTWKAERCHLRSRVMIRGRTRWRYGRHSVRHRCKNRGRHSGGRHSGRFPGSVQLDMVMNLVNPFQVIPHKVRSALGHTLSTVRTRFCNRVYSFSASPAVSNCRSQPSILHRYDGFLC